jgi:hypothetical protein
MPCKCSVHFSFRHVWNAHIKKLGKAEFASCKRTVYSIAYRFVVELDLPHKFIIEEELASMTG